MNNKNIVIIGGSGGIGRETIKLLLTDDFNIINIDRVALNIDSPNYTEFVVEITMNNINDIISMIVSKFPNIYGFISAIGYYGVDTYESFSHSKYYNTIFINVDIPTLFAANFVKLMSKRNSGKMIFLSSAAAYIGSRDIAYSISKAAILGLLRGLCKNFQEKNIFFYGVAPGIVITDMSNKMSERRKMDAINGTINKRQCTPLEIAKLIRFLLIEDDGYMNGSVLHINDGLYLN